MNPSEIVALSQNIEKLGIIGVLVLVTILLGYAAFHFRKELMTVYAQREKETKDLRADIEKLKLMYLVVKTAADGAGVKYDLRGIGDIDSLLSRHEP